MWIIWQIYQNLRRRGKAQHFTVMSEQYLSAVTSLWSICEYAYHDERKYLREVLAQTPGFARNYNYFLKDGKATYRLRLQSLLPIV